MTYCVAMLLDTGLVFLSDSRTNAGVDQISTFRKTSVFEHPGERVLVLQTSGNLAIAQSVTSILRERTRTIDFLAGLKKDQFDGAETREISLKAGGRELNFKGFAYLETWAKPNFFFHLTTAYAILRHNGIELGKPDFLAGGQ